MSFLPSSFRRFWGSSGVVSAAVSGAASIPSAVSEEASSGTAVGSSAATTGSTIFVTAWRWTVARFPGESSRTTLFS
jgi:hypothetical protein